MHLFGHFRYVGLYNLVLECVRPFSLLAEGFESQPTQIGYTSTGSSDEKLKLD